MCHPHQAAATPSQRRHVDAQRSTLVAVVVAATTVAATTAAIRRPTRRRGLHCIVVAVHVCLGKREAASKRLRAPLLLV